VLLISVGVYRCVLP